MSLLEIKNLRKYYTKKFPKSEVTRAVDGISFNVEEGEFFGFLGPNGAGKTTTIRAILGLLREVKGEIFFLGKKINPNKDVKYRGDIGYIPGELGMDKELTGLEICKYMARLQGEKFNHSKVKEISKRLKLNLSKPVQKLSKGNRQKIGIVAALMKNSPLYILDEPTSGLDPIIKNEFYNLLIDQQKKTGCSIFLCSHILSEVEKYCDRVAIIRLGKIVEFSGISHLKEMGLKRFELEFQSNGGLEEFRSFLKDKYPESEVVRTHNSTIEILVQPEVKRKIIHEISERLWDGDYISDFNVSDSTLENIFMKYYENEPVGGAQN